MFMCWPADGTLQFRTPQMYYLSLDRHSAAGFQKPTLNLESSPPDAANRPLSNHNPQDGLRASPRAR